MALAVTDVVNNAVTDVTSSGATRTVNLPTTSVEEGDMMVICMNINKASADIGDVLTTPAGWTKAGTQGLPDTASTPRMYVYWRAVPGGGLGSTVDITSSDTAIGHVAVAYAIQAADTTALDVFAAASTGTSSTLSCPGATATNTGGLILRHGCSDDNDESSQPAMTAHTSINWEDQSSPSNGHGVFTYVAVQPSTTIAAATISLTASEQWGGITFVVAEGSNVTITDVETDEDFDDKDTALTITGTGYEATKGTGKVELASESDYAAATKIEQTTTSWADTSIDFTADLSTLTPGLLYLFVTNDSAERSSGFPVTCHRAVAFTLAASANIPASGAATTFQLIAPATKSTTDFIAGRIQDDENPFDAVNIPINDYTEHETCIKATNDAEGQHEFRQVLSDNSVYTTYTILPKWTISAGTLYFKTNTGGLTPAGALVRLTMRDMLGSITAAGALQKYTARKFTGQIFLAGGLTKQAQKILAGSITMSGTLATVYKVFQAVAGSITPTGALVKQAGKILAGSITSTGALSRQTNKMLAGSLTATGALVKMTMKTLTGSITMTGALSVILLLLATVVGSITCTGSLVSVLLAPATFDARVRRVRQVMGTLIGRYSNRR